MEEVCEPGNLLPRAFAIAEIIASKVPLRVAAAKEATSAALNLALEDGLSSNCVFSALLFHEGQGRGVRAFNGEARCEFSGDDGTAGCARRRSHHRRPHPYTAMRQMKPRDGNDAPRKEEHFDCSTGAHGRPKPCCGS